MTPKPKMRTKTTLKTALKILHERVYPLASEDKFDEAARDQRLDGFVKLIFACQRIDAFVKNF